MEKTEKKLSFIHIKEIPSNEDFNHIVYICGTTEQIIFMLSSLFNALNKSIPIEILITAAMMMRDNGTLEEIGVNLQ